jgi:hypothetical protein
MCDSYEARLMELLGNLEDGREETPQAVPTHECEQDSFSSRGSLTGF